MKVANQLTRAGYLKAVRGRSGGLTLAKRPNRIKLGEVLRATEPDFALVECFTADNQCIITPRCRLRGALKEALAAFTGRSIAIPWPISSLLPKPSALSPLHSSHVTRTTAAGGGEMRMGCVPIRAMSRCWA